MPAGSDLVAAVLEQLGTPYLWGGKTEGGLDCSGSLHVAMADVGVDFPVGNSATQIDACQDIPVDQAWDTPGAVLYRPGHIVISTGWRGTEASIEATVAGGVALMPYSATYDGAPRFTRGGLVPGIDYTTQEDAAMAMVITSKFGLRKVFGKANMHRGLDYRSRLGDARPSLFDGVVIEVRSGRVPGAPVGRADRNGTPALDRTLSGNGVKIRRADGHIYVEAHMDPAVRVGDRISRGDVLGHTDLSGTITAAHAHTELWTSDDPDTYYDPTTKVLAAAKAPIAVPEKEWSDMATKQEIQDAVREVIQAEVGNAVWRHDFGAEDKYGVPAENAGERVRAVRIHAHNLNRSMRIGIPGVQGDGVVTGWIKDLARRAGINV